MLRITATLSLARAPHWMPFVCTIGTSRFGARVHRGLWFGKAFVLLGLLVATLFVDNSAMAAYLQVSNGPPKA